MNCDSNELSMIWVISQASSDPWVVLGPVSNWQHNSTCGPMDLIAELWNCGLCSFFCFFPNQQMSHLNTVHCNEVNFSQKCGLPGCPSKTVYTSMNSLIKHVHTSHRELLSCMHESIHNNSEDHNVIHEVDDSDIDETGNLFTLSFYAGFAFPRLMF